MVFSRKRKYFRKFRKFRGRKRPRLATKKYVIKKIRQQIETKYLDIQLSPGFTVDWSGSVFSQLTNIQQGLTDSQRVGDSVKIRSVKIKINITKQDAANEDDHVRICIFQWYPNTALLAPTAAMLFPAAFIGTGNAPTMPWRYDTRDQYGILYDKTFSISSSDAKSKAWNFKPNLKFAKKTVQFDAATTSAANHLYLIMFNSSSAAASTTTVGYNSRLFYDDA